MAHFKHLILTLGIIEQSFYWFLVVSNAITRADIIESTETMLNSSVLADKDPTSKFEMQYLNSLQHKLDSITDVLGQVDDSVKSLQEKAHTWAIFHHHIDSWNDQMKALEHKVDIIKRGQDEYQTYNNKLMSLEFTLNHILRKVVYLSESCNSHQQSLNTAKISTTQEADADIVEMLRDLHRSLDADKKMRNEMLTRLSNILHRVQKIESGNFRAGREPKDEGATQKLARLMHPVGGCNASQRYNYNIEQSLKTLELKLGSFTTSLAPKDFKQLLSLAKKNSRALEEIAHSVTQTEAALVQWREIEANHSKNLHEYCQDVSGELSTFTESSDHLLKRIEYVVGDVNEKLNRLSCDGAANQILDNHDETLNVNVTPNIMNSNETDSTEEPFVESFELEIADDIEDEQGEEDGIGTSRRPTDIDYVQHSKLGCHELIERIDGIYKFATPDLNEVGRDFNERFCSFATDGSAWTIMQNRGPYSEQESFNRSWADYRNGFGRLDKDFWYGNEFIHRLVYSDDYELRIEMQDFDDVRVWVDYSIFRLDSERFNYNLLIGGYRGAVPDAMQYHNELDFSTYDRRNDKSVDACCACATGYASGWWYDNCSEANLNGIYHDNPLGHNYVGIIWEHWRGDYSLKSARMLIRPTNYSVAVAKYAVYNEFTEDP